MTELVLLVGIPIAVVIAFAKWKLGVDRRATRESCTPGRRREDARDWQRRFGAEGLPGTNFFPPTQNEVLETLSLLDHLAPRWEADDAVTVESVFLNELALNFPTLRKAGCPFPLAPNDNPQAAEIAARREAFRAQRAQSNALDQITSSPVAPGETAPTGAPFGLSGNGSARNRRNVWPILLGSAAVLVAAALISVRFLPETVYPKTVRQPDAEATSAVPAVPAVPSVAPVIAEPAAQPTPMLIEAVAEVTQTPPPVPAAQVVETPPMQAPRATPSQIAAAIQKQIADSKQRAVSKYPALAVEGSEINLRFVFRYKNLVQEKSPRLLDPKWPEELAEECAAAAAATAKRDSFTRVLGAPR